MQLPQEVQSPWNWSTKKLFYIVRVHPEWMCHHRGLEAQWTPNTFLCTLQATHMLRACDFASTRNWKLTGLTKDFPKTSRVYCVFNENITYQHEKIKSMTFKQTVQEEYTTIRWPFWDILFLMWQTCSLKRMLQSYLPVNNFMVQHHTVTLFCNHKVLTL